MRADLTPLRLRVALPPRQPAPLKSGPPPRRVLLVHERHGDVVLLDLVDGQPTACLVALAEGSDMVATSAAERWVASRSLGPDGLGLVPGVVGRRQLGRYVEHRGYDRAAAIAAFDLAGTLGSVAAHPRQGRGSALTLTLAGCGWRHRETGRPMDSYYRARVMFVSRGGDGGAFGSWLPPRKRRRRRRKPGGPFLQLDVLGAALGCDTTSPADLAASLGIPWPEREGPLDQLLDEASVLVEIYRLLVAELAEVAPGLLPQDCWSVGSIATYILRAAGMRPPAETTTTLPPWAVGACAAAVHGGEAGAWLVGVPLPIALGDLSGTFSAMFSLLGLTPHLVADRFEVEHVKPAEIERLFDPDGLRERLDERSRWQSIGALFVLVEPRGEALPCHRRVGDRWRFVVSPLDLSGGTLSVHGCDLIRPALEGQLPRIVHGFRIRPVVAAASGLRPVRLPSGREIDLTMPGADWGRAVLDERLLAASIEDPLVRARSEPLAKGLAVTGCWGFFARDDRRLSPRPVVETIVGPDGRERRHWRYPRTATVEAIGPTGEAVATATDHPEEAGPLTLWHLAAAVPAACRGIMALTRHDVEAVGGSIAAEATDAFAIPAAPESRLVECPGGPQRLPDGREAVRLLGRDELRAILGRFDRLLRPWGGAAWKGEVGSLDAETLGLVVGTNKVLLGRRDDTGRLSLLRSSDTSLGDHYVDPSGTGWRLDDGRTAWSSELEAAVLSVVVGDLDRPLRVPRDLPLWADDRPAMRPGRASNFADLAALRRQVGHDGVPPFACYVRVGGDDGPICLGDGRDPETWRSWPWHRDGLPCRVAVLDSEGGPDTSTGTGVVHQVPTMRDVLYGWLCEQDQTVGGPARGLRHVLPVRSHPALVQLVGKSGEYSGLVADDDPLLFESPTAVEQLLDEARSLGSGLLANRGVPARTAKRVARRKGAPAPETVGKLAAALADGRPERRCDHCGDSVMAGARVDARYCSPACREAARRARLRKADPGAPGDIPPPEAAPTAAPPAAVARADEIRRTIELLAGLPGLPPAPLGLAALRRSPKLPGVISGCLVAGATPEVLAERLRADGPLRGASPVGILISRLEGLAPVLIHERQARLTAIRQRNVAWGQRVAGQVLSGDLPDAETGRDVIAAEESDPAVQAVAVGAFEAVLGEHSRAVAP